MSGFFSWLFGRPAKPAPGRQASVERQEQVRKLAAEIEAVVTPDRRELIRQAMAIRKSKSRILEDLGDEQKRRLYALAVKQLLHENDPKP